MHFSISASSHLRRLDRRDRTRCCSEGYSACRQGSWQGNSAEGLSPEAPIDIEIALQREDLGDVQAL